MSTPRYAALFLGLACSFAATGSGFQKKKPPNPVPTAAEVKAPTQTPPSPARVATASATVAKPAKPPVAAKPPLPRRPAPVRQAVKPSHPMAPVAVVAGSGHSELASMPSPPAATHVAADADMAASALDPEAIAAAEKEAKKQARREKIDRIGSSLLRALIK